jgi:maltose-binding protein MalE
VTTRARDRACFAVAFTASLAATVSLPDPARADGSGERAVSVWHAYRGDEERALGELARRYEAERGVRVDLLAIPFEAYTSKLAAAVPHAHGPDVFIEAHERLGVYMKSSLVTPVGDAFPDEDVALFDATSVRAVTVNGVRFGVPLANKCLALYVNEALLPQTPASIEGLAKLAPSFASGTYALAYEAQSAYFHAPFLHAFGGAMLDDTGKFAFASAESARSLAFVRDLARSNAVPEEPSGDLVTKLFVSGHAAAVISGPWLSADIKGPVKYRIEPLPAAIAGGGVMRPFLTVEAAFTTPTGAQRENARASAL